MVDFKRLLSELQETKGYCVIDPVVMPRKLTGIWNGEQEVEVTLGVKYQEAYAWPEASVMTPVLTVIEGGVTGFEAWYIDHLIAMDLMDDPVGDRFYINAGGMGWPSLYLKTEDVQQYIKDFQAQEVKLTY